MHSPRLRRVSRQRALARRAALCLVLGACFLTACDVFPPGQPQHAGPPAHTLFVSYLLAQKPVTTASNLVNNSIDYVVAAMATGDGKKIWQTTVPGMLDWGQSGTTGGARRASVVVSGPIVYALIDVGNRGAIAALDAYTGKLLWTHIEATNPIFEVKAANGIVFIQVGLNTLQALDGQNGRRLWQLSSGTYYTLGSFVIAGQTVYVVHQSFGPERLHDPDTSTYYFVKALRATDGKQIWRTGVERTENTVGYRLQADDARVYVLKPSYEGAGVNLPGTVVALRASDGSALWTYQEPRFIEADFGLFQNTLVGQTLYLVASPMIALDAQDGKQLWTYETRFHVTQFFPPDHLYGLTLEPGEEFCWLRLTDGAKQWCAPLSPASRVIAGADNLYFLGYQTSQVPRASQDHVMVVSQSDGHVVNQYQIDDPLRMSPGAIAGEG